MNIIDLKVQIERLVTTIEDLIHDDIGYALLEDIKHSLSYLYEGIDLYEEAEHKWIYDPKERFEYLKRHILELSDYLSYSDDHIKKLLSLCENYLVESGFELPVEESESTTDEDQFSQPSMKLVIDHGSASQKYIADLLSDISVLYKLSGGSGINYSLDNIYYIDKMEDGA